MQILSNLGFLIRCFWEKLSMNFRSSSKSAIRGIYKVSFVIRILSSLCKLKLKKTINQFAEKLCKLHSHDLTTRMKFILISLTLIFLISNGVGESSMGLHKRYLYICVFHLFQKSDIIRNLQFFCILYRLLVVSKFKVRSIHPRYSWISM